MDVQRLAAALSRLAGARSSCACAPKKPLFVPPTLRLSAPYCAESIDSPFRMRFAFAMRPRSSAISSWKSSAWARRRRWAIAIRAARAVQVDEGRGSAPAHRHHPAEELRDSALLFELLLPAQWFDGRSELSSRGIGQMTMFGSLVQPGPRALLGPRRAS